MTLVAAPKAARLTTTSAHVNHCVDCIFRTSRRSLAQQGTERANVFRVAPESGPRTTRLIALVASDLSATLRAARTGHDNDKEAPIMDPIRRTILATGAAATAMAASPRVFAQQTGQ